MDAPDGVDPEEDADEMNEPVVVSPVTITVGAVTVVTVTIEVTVVIDSPVEAMIQYSLVLQVMDYWVMHLPGSGVEIVGASPELSDEEAVALDSVTVGCGP